MIIKFKDPNRRIHGKLHKRDPYYFRYHYGEQRLVYMVKPYIDCPTEKQKASRQAFTELRQEVARQLHDPILRTRWEARFKRDPQGYKMLHTYVYAKLKAGETVTVETRRWCVSPNNPVGLPNEPLTLPMLGNKGDVQKGVSTSIVPVIVVYNGYIIPMFLPWKIPKREKKRCEIEAMNR